MRREDFNEESRFEANARRFKDDLFRMIDKMVDWTARMDLDELADIYDNQLQRLIRRKEKNEALNYVGGEFVITYVTESVFSLRFTLYFQDQDKQWKKMDAKTSRSMRYLKDRAVKELIEKKQIVYEVELTDSQAENLNPVDESNLNNNSKE